MNTTKESAMQPNAVQRLLGMGADYTAITVSMFGRNFDCTRLEVIAFSSLLVSLLIAAAYLIASVRP